MTPEQEAKLRLLCERYHVTFNPDHYFQNPEGWIMPGWVEGWVGGTPSTIYVGVAPDGSSHS